MLKPSCTGVQANYLQVLEADAPTLSGSSTIRYAVFTDAKRSQVFLTIVANRGGGNWNREVVSLADIETVLGDVPAGEPFASKVLRQVFVGRSNNNPTFLAAALVHAGLLAPAPEVKHKLVVVGDWTAWQAEMLARDGEVVVFPPGAGDALSAAPVVEAAGKKAKRVGRRATGDAGADASDEDSRHADHP